MRYLTLLLLSGCVHEGKDSIPPDEHDTDTPVDTGERIDADGDGFRAAEDCDDGDLNVHPGAEEVCDGMDQDCDGSVDEEAVDAPTWYPDADGDGWGVEASAAQDCTQPSGTSALGGDCDDADPAVSPGAAEICGNGVDDDCDRTSHGCGLWGDLSLADADAVLVGPVASGRAGYDVAGAGDVNGDGYADLLVGAPDAFHPGTWEGDGYPSTSRTGAAMVVLGPVSGEVDLLTAEAWIQGNSLETRPADAWVCDTARGCARNPS